MMASTLPVIPLRNRFAALVWMLVVFLGAPLRAAEGDWSCFRGPGRMGVSDAKGLPVSWSASENIAWKIALPGPGASSPIVWGDRIYITCYTGYFVPGEPGGSLDQLKRHLIALNKSDGKTLWSQAVPAKLPEEPKIRDHGYAASTPAADADRVYIFFGKSGVFAFDHSGKQVWQADVGARTNGWGSAASPVLYKDLVIINASVESDALIALNKNTGKEVWRAGGIKQSWNTPILAAAPSGRQELVLAIQGDVLGFDPDTGKQLWSCKTNITWYMVPSVVADKGVVYSIGGRSGVAGLAVKMGGSGDVTGSHRLWTSQNGANVSSPVCLDGHVYYLHQDGSACCMKADSGELVYRERLGRGDQLYASALLADGKIFALTRSGKTFVLAAKPKFEQLGMGDLTDRSIFNASPAIDGQRLLIRSDKFLYCVGK